MGYQRMQKLVARAISSFFRFNQGICAYFCIIQVITDPMQKHGFKLEYLLKLSNPTQVGYFF